MSAQRATPEQIAETKFYLRMLAVHARQRAAEIQQQRDRGETPGPPAAQQLRLLQDTPPLDLATLARERAHRRASRGGSHFKL